MRTHAQIIRDATVAAVRATLKRAGLPVSEHTVRAWLRRPDRDGAIPAGYWRALCRAHLTRATELMASAELRLKQANP